MSTRPISADYRGARALVLGASGFIGRWVARALGERSARVYMAVRNRAIAEKIFSRYSVRGEVIEIDLANSGAVRDILDLVKPAVTFNLAGYGVDPSERDERIAEQMNVRLLAALCDAIGTTRDPEWAGYDIVHVGSAQEYGAIRGNLAEDSDPNPMTTYGKTKLAGTRLLSQECQKSKIKGVTARLFTVYGPGEHKGRLLPSLLETAMNRNFLPLTEGKQSRDFTFVEDVAEGLLRLGVSSKPLSVVNLATGKLTSVREFVEVAAGVLQISGDKLGFGLVPTRTDEMEHSQVSVQRLKQWLGWVPPTGIGEGIRRTAAFETIDRVLTA